ncbi:DNA repair protein RAD50 [Fagus crenata]
MDWLNKFHGARLEHLNVTNSDHKCLHLEFEPCNQPQYSRKPFRFEEIWTSDSGCEATVQAEWDKWSDGTAMFQVWNKLKNCKKGLGKWSRPHFGNVTRQLVEKRHQLQEAEVNAIQGGGLDILKKLKTINKDEHRGQDANQRHPELRPVEQTRHHLFQALNPNRRPQQRWQNQCLKLSCTGELPPNARSGHSFIHDPKVAGETETKGQIKLRFKTAAGKDVVCIRSFQLTEKASKMEYKAIESVLQTINPHIGEKVCLSYRCADMDREIPALMGVSKAVLENVIFVHQDEANWPLQDSSTLKKKFDDIFSATRYGAYSSLDFCILCIVCIVRC